MVAGLPCAVGVCMVVCVPALAVVGPVLDLPRVSHHHCCAIPVDHTARISIPYHTVNLNNIKTVRKHKDVRELGSGGILLAERDNNGGGIAHDACW